MKKNRIIWWGVIVVLVGVLVYLVLSNKPAEETNINITPAPTPAADLEGEVIIGAIAPLTGDNAAYGIPMHEAIQMAIDDINSVRGINGKKLVVKAEDGKCDLAEGATVAQKLIDVEKVNFILSEVCSNEFLSYADEINKNKVVSISSSASSSDITEKGGEYFFRLMPSDAFAGRISANYAHNNLGARTAAIISENKNDTQALRGVFTDAFKAAGGTIVVDEVYDEGTTDFQTQALKIKNADVDVVYLLPQTSASGISLVKALRDQRVDEKILAAEVLIGHDVASKNAELLEGVIGFELYFNEESSRAKSFLDKYEARFGKEAPFPLYMANAYSSVFLVKDLIEANNETDMEAVQKTLSNLEGWAGGALGNVTLDKNGDIVSGVYSVKTIRNGEVTKTDLVEL